MKKFLTFHAVTGETVLIRPDAIISAMPGKVPTPGLKFEDCTVIQMINGSVGVKENIEQVEAMLTEPDFA